MSAPRPCRPQRRRHARRLRAQPLLGRPRHAARRDLPEGRRRRRHLGQPPKRVLYRNIRAAAESGWDFSSRWFADGQTLATIDTTNIVPVDLNSLLYGLERAIARAARKNRIAACAHGLRRPRRTPARGDEPLSLGCARRARSSITTGSPDAPRMSRAPRRSIRFSSAWRTPRRRAPLPIRVRAQLLEAGRPGAPRQPHRPAMGRTQRLGAAAMDRGGGSARATGSRSGRRHRVALAGDGRRTLRRDRQARREIRRRASNRQGGGGEYPLQDGFGWTNGVTVALLHLCPSVGDAKTAISRQCSLAAAHRR